MAVVRIGASLFLIAVGAILKFAVTATVGGVDLGMIGIILMVVGAIGLLITIVLMSTRRRTDVIHQPGGAYVAGDRVVGQQPSRTTYVEPTDPRY